MDLEEGHMGSVLSKLGDLLKGDYVLPKGATKDDLKSLERELRRLRACYYDVAGGALDSYISCLARDVFYEADNLVDFLLMPVDLRSLFKKTKDSLRSPHDMARIKEITKEAQRTFTRMSGDEMYQHFTAIYKLDETEMPLFGIDGPTNELIKKLEDGDDISRKQTRVVSIVGIAGLGKTALARIVYKQLKPHFDRVAFLKVPHEPGMVGFFTDMLGQLDAANLTNIDEEAQDERLLISQIGEFLQDKRYLVVIDDVWNEEDWDNILCCLPSNGYGSRVITTTPFHAIANLCCSGHDESIYEIQHLGYLDSINLFSMGISIRELSCHNLPMGFFHEILEMCGGMPSAIFHTATVLATEVTPTKPWQEMINSVYSAWKQKAILCTDPENIPGYEDLRIIILIAYCFLPCTLKDCLLYIAVHAKNQIIHRTTMVRNWIAEGFICAYGRCSQEEVANRYFDELIKKNFIHLGEYGNYLGEEIYEINYMVFYALRKRAQDESFTTILSKVDNLWKYRNSVRLSINCSGPKKLISTGSMDSSRIRSIITAVPATFSSSSTTDLVCIRVLDLDGCKNLGNYFMNPIFRMILLKYLSLKHTNVSVIPPEIRKLQNLLTLDVRHTKVKELPKEVVQLLKLAHLYFGQCSSPCGVKLPAGSDQLKSVKVLGTVDSREWTESAMEEISGLTGVTELEVVLHDQSDDEEQNHMLLSSIGKCRNLAYLIIYGEYSPSEDVLLVSPSFTLLERLKVAGRFMKVPRWIAQLTTLKKLDVILCKLDEADLEILGGLPGLSPLAIELVCIPRKKEVTITNMLQSSTSTDLHPPDEETSHASFPSLDFFNFDCHMPWIIFEQGAMPRLKHLHLKLYACPADKFPSGIINLRSLEKIIIWYSSRYASSSGVRKAVSAVREEASLHGNLIKLSVNGEHEVFQSNTRVEEIMTSTEIQE